MFRAIADKFFFLIDGESIKKFLLNSLSVLDTVKLAKFFISPIPAKPLQVMRLHFNNSISIGSGFDVNADHIDFLARLGFGCLEFGTITPYPQLGNDEKKQSTILYSKNSVINKTFDRNMGINYLVKNLENCSYRGVIGVHINKNLVTPSEHLLDDLQYCMRKLIKVANYVSIELPENVLDDYSKLNDFLGRLKDTQKNLLKREGLYLSIVIKLPLNIELSEIEKFANYAIKHQIDGINCSSPKMTISPVEGLLHGKAIQALSLRNQNKLIECLAGIIPVIASGGIMNSQDIKERLNAGAKVVQLNSGLLLSGLRILKGI